MLKAASYIFLLLMVALLVDMSIKSKQPLTQKKMGEIRKAVKVRDKVGEILIRGFTAKCWENGKVTKVLSAELGVRRAGDNFFLIKDFVLFEKKCLTNPEDNVKWTITKGKLAKVNFLKGDIQLIGKFSRKTK